VSVSGVAITGGNAVWRRFIVNQMPEWLKWLKSVHLPSHFRLWSKYLEATTPKNAFARMKRVQGEDEELLSLLFVPPESFWEQLQSEVGESKTAKMYRVALSITMDDFLHDITLYAQQFPEMRQIYVLLNTHQEWFDEFLNYLRAELYEQWHEKNLL
jgi:hypothetical protein